MTRIAARAHSILIVEDDDDSRTLLGHLLAGEGYRVQMARNGLEGLRAAHAYHPDLILLDVQMPVMDGFAFRQRQLEDPGLAGIPVVCVSALDGASMHEDLGVVQFVRKPIDFDRLLNVITTSTMARARGAGAGPDVDPRGADGAMQRSDELAHARLSWRSRSRVPTMWRIG